jgi:hypothetical protein
MFKKGKTTKLFLIIIAISLLGSLFQLSCKNANETQIAKNINRRIVQIVLLSQPTDSSAALTITLVGTGVMISNDGYIITAKHLLNADEQYLKQKNENTNKLGAIISSAAPNQDSINDFDVINVDVAHDIALLKLKSTNVISPLNGTVINEFHLGNGLLGTLNIGDVRLQNDISQNSNIAITGYPSNRLPPVIKTGKVVSKEITEAINSAVLLETGNITYTVSNYFQSDIISNPSLSGSPVYSPDNGDILGICINLPGTGYQTVIISSRYILAVLTDNNISLK